MDIKDIRAKYPQYSDLSDEQLLQGFHKKFYSDMPYEQFASKITGASPGDGNKPFTPKPIGKEGFADALKETLQGTDWGTRNLAAAGTALSNLWEGAKQIVGKGDEERIKANRQIAESAPVGSIAGNVALLAPTALIPGANTVAGAGAVGAISGALQPTVGDESRLANIATGGAAGVAGQAVGNKIGSILQSRAQQKAAELAAQQSRNSVKDATLAEARGAGFTIPNSEVAPSFLGNRLESLGGKAAIKQEATARNQEVANSLARKALGLPDDTPITQNAIDEIRKTAGKAYEEVSKLTPRAKDELEMLKQARNDAQGWFNAYNRSASPADLAKAKASREIADTLEKSLEDTAKQAGRPELISALRDARKEIAKSYTVQRALNPATGDISMPVLGRMNAKGAPLSDGLDVAARFQNAFPKFSTEGVKSPAAGVSKSEMLAAALLGAGGHTITGNPVGLTAAALPMLSHPARSLALSKALQKSPSYAPGAINKLLQELPPEEVGALMRALSISAGQGISGTAPVLQ